MTARITTQQLEADAKMRRCLPADHPLHLPRNGQAVPETVTNGLEGATRRDQARNGKACGCGTDRAATGLLDGKTGEPAADMSGKDAISSDMPEKTLQRLIEGDLRQHGIKAHHDRVTRGNRKGYPDIVFAVKRNAADEYGVPVALELKTATGRLKPEQEETLAAMSLNGWHAHVVRSWQQYRAIMEQLTGGEWARVPAESEG